MILTVREISEALNARAEEFVRWLLPNGKKEGQEWVVGSVNGEAGKSLKIRLGGVKTGRWADFASDDRGDLVGLIAAIRGASLKDSIKLAKDWLGIRDPENTIPRKVYQKPKPKGIKKLEDSSEVFEYLADVRKLDVFTQTDFKIAQSIGENGPEICFPYIDPDGNLVNVKRIAIKRDPTGKKFVRQESGCAPSLFGWQALKPDTREVILCEGELDCLTMHQMGFPALSVPDGATGSTWIDVEWENLQRFERIWLNWDNDNAGQKAVREFAQRLGYARCFILTFPGFKDANEALMADKDNDFFAKAIAAAKPLTPEQIKTPKDFEDRVFEKFYPSNGIEPGFFSNFFDKKLGMRPGEVTVWTGISSHGKSMVLSQLMLEAMLAGKRVAIGSFEMRGEQTLHRMLCQSEIENPVKRYKIRKILDWLGGKLWIFDLLGNVQTKMALDLMEYCYARFRVDIFVLDSLMKCSVSSDDYDGQRVFLNQLCSFAKQTNTHVNLVAHARKGKDESETPGKLDVKGSSDIINQADNVLTIWRNKDKEQAIFDGKTLPNDPDTIIYCNKQRETGEEFKIRCRFLKGTFFVYPMKLQLIPRVSIWSAIKEEDITVTDPEEPQNNGEPQPDEAQQTLV